MAKKQNFLQRIFSFRRTSANNKSLVRLYKAGESNRLTNDWVITGSQHADSDLRNSIELVRGRARDLFQNNDYVKRYINLCIMNIVGHNGFAFQSKVQDTNGLFDSVANNLIENAFYEWCKKENCTVSGNLNFIDVQKLLVTQAARDGEFFVRLIKNPSVKFGLQIYIYEPEDIDHNYNSDLDNGNIIRLGIEFNKQRKVVAYYFKKSGLENLNSGYNYTSNYERVEAENIIHCFVQDRARQSRGISWLVQSMLRLKHLSGYEEASLINARVGAAKMGFFQSEMGEEYIGSATDEDKNVEVSAEPGSFEQLPPGVKFQSFEPDFPQQQYSDYVKACLRGISSGLGVSYNLLANDLEGVNYSSIRAGLLDERENWKHLQNWFIINFLEVLFKNWLEMALLTNSVSLPFSKIEKFNKPEFIGRRWAWVDPKSDIEAKLLELNAGFATATQVAAEMGKDLEDIYKDLKREKDLREKYGLSFDTGKENVDVVSKDVQKLVGANNATTEKGVSLNEILKRENVNSTMNGVI